MATKHILHVEECQAEFKKIFLLEVSLPLHEPWASLTSHLTHGISSNTGLVMVIQFLGTGPHLF